MENSRSTRSDLLAGFAATFGESRPVAANRPANLNDPQVALYVEHGAIDVLAAEHADGQMQSPYKHIMRLEQGRIAFGVDQAGHSHRLVVKGLPESRLRCLPLENLFEALEERRDGHKLTGLLTAQIDAWIEAFAASVVREMEGLPPIEARLSPGCGARSGTVSAERGVVWVLADDLDADFVDLTPAVANGPGMMPVTPDSWIRLGSDAGTVCKSSGELGLGTLLSRGLPEFHRLALASEYSARRLMLVDDANSQVAQATKRRREKMLARKNLSALFQAERQVEDDGVLLGAALRMVGRHEGIEIRTPVMTGGQEPSLRDYCEASGVRQRRVRLAAQDRWWLGDSGAMLAFCRDGGRPVVLLPGRAGRYRIVDPETGKSSPAGANTASEIHDARMLYPGLQTATAVGTKALLRVGGAEIRSQFAQLAAMGLCAGLLALSPAIAVQLLIGDVLTEGGAASLIQLSAVLVGLAFAAALSHILRGTALMRLEASLAARIGAAIQDRLLRMRPGFFRRRNAGELVSRSMVFQDIRDHVAGITVDAILSTLFALPAFVLLCYYSATLGLAVLGLGAAAIGVTAAYCILHIEPQRRHQEVLRELTGELQQFFNGIAKLRTTASEDSAYAAWAKRYQQQKRLDIRLSWLSERIAAFCAAMPALASAVLFLAVLVQGDSGLSTADFLAAYTAAMVFFFSIVMLGKSVRAISFVKPACDQLLPILASPADGGPRSGARHALEGEILLDRVTFGYPDTGATVLNNVTIHAKRGEFIAVVGESGAGKSTLFRLALGLERPLSGAVYYDNRDLAHLDVGTVRRQIGVVTQNGTLQNGSILDNIIGVADDLTLEDAWRAARQAAVDGDIKDMPMGLYTPVTEDSSTFSGGQAQRIRIAAALVRQPRILFLDEPTSWLDTRNQARTMKGIEESTATRLVIAHRLSTIRMANRIYVLRDGRVAQVGEFDELLAADGPFRELALRQMS